MLAINYRLIHYDNISHWALVVKQMLITDAIPDAASSLIDFKNYPSKLVDLKSSFKGTSGGFLFGDRGNSYMNEYSFYLTYFG